MIIIKTTDAQISFPKNVFWCIYARNEHYLDEHGRLAEDISAGFGPYHDICIHSGENLDFVLSRVYAGYEVVNRLIQFINLNIHQTTIIADLNQLCIDGPGYHQLGKSYIRR